VLNIVILVWQGGVVLRTVQSTVSECYATLRNEAQLKKFVSHGDPQNAANSPKNTDNYLIQAY
jgi:hypothetical protein